MDIFRGWVCGCVGVCMYIYVYAPFPFAIYNFSKRDGGPITQLPTKGAKLMPRVAVCIRLRAGEEGVTGKIGGDFVLVLWVCVCV